jgi:hypothetical protein
VRIPRATFAKEVRDVAHASYAYLMRKMRTPKDAVFGHSIRISDLPRNLKNDNFIVLFQPEDITGWKIKRIIDHKQEFSFDLPTTHLTRGQSVTVCFLYVFGYTL